MEIRKGNTAEVFDWDRERSVNYFIKEYLMNTFSRNTKMPKNFLNWVFVYRRCLNSWTVLGGMELFMKRLRGFRCGSI